MEELISRLNKERLELIERVNKLGKFFSKYNYIYSNEYIELLKKQHSIMIDYVNVLDDRIALLKGRSDDND